MRGDRIKEERKRLYLTQEQLGNKIGASRSNIANWENNQNNPSLEMCFKLAEIFNCDIAYITGHSDIRGKYNPGYELNQNTDIGDLKKYMNSINVEEKDIALVVEFAKKIKSGEPIEVIKYDNAEYVTSSTNTIKIPVYGVIKAGTPIEAQQDILEYTDIPAEWASGGKKYYGLKITGDSMAPKYQPNDLVIFEQTDDLLQCNGKDCAIMVNGYDATFKNVRLSEAGIQLIPLNMNNADGYVPTFYNSEQIQTLPIKIVGIAREKRTKL